MLGAQRRYAAAPYAGMSMATAAVLSSSCLTADDFYDDHVSELEGWSSRKLSLPGWSHLSYANGVALSALCFINTQNLTKA